MGVNRKQFVTRNEYAEENKRLTKINKAGKYLNVYIVAAAALTIIILAMTIATNGSEEVASTKPPEPAKEVVLDDLTEKEPVEEELVVEELTAENTVVTIDDPVVEEIQTNDSWPAHPTEQTGPHTSTFQKGHIDYEEKLAAIFSVTDLEQGASFVKSVKNNGSASSAIAVITSQDGSKMYRVSIEWIDETGWKPVKLEVLKTLNGAY